MDILNNCQSCGMSIDDGTYCEYCADENGELQPFEDRFVKMIQWMVKEDKNLSIEEAETKTKAYMRSMPAWKNHPKLTA